MKWVVASGLAGLVAARLAEEAAIALWRRTMREDPPYDPAYDPELPGVDWRREVLWTAGVAMLTAAAQVAARRGAAIVWERSMKRRPPRRPGARRRRKRPA